MFSEISAGFRLNLPGAPRLWLGGVAQQPFVAQVRHDEVLFDGLLALTNAGLVDDYLTELELKSSEANRG